MKWLKRLEDKKLDPDEREKIKKELVFSKQELKDINDSMRVKIAQPGLKADFSFNFYDKLIDIQVKERKHDQKLKIIEEEKHAQPQYLGDEALK